MAEYTIKLVDIAAEARERLGDLASTLMPGDDPDWRLAITHRGKRIIFADNTTAASGGAWLEANDVQPDVRGIVRDIS